jgi:hypothetical protein
LHHHLVIRARIVGIDHAHAVGRVAPRPDKPVLAGRSAFADRPWSFYI